MKKHWRGIITSFLLGLACVTLVAQATNISSSGTLPTHCTVGNVYIKTGTSAGLYRCSATDTWTQLQDLLSSVTEALLSFTDITTANATTSAHGLMPKADGTSTHYWGGDAGWHALGSGLTLLEQHTASSSATLDFVSWYSSTYDTYLVTLTTVKPATTANQLTLIVSTNGGFTWDSTSGHYAWSHILNYPTTSAVEASASATYIAVGGNAVSSTIIGMSGTINIFNPSATDFQGFTLSTLRYATSVSTVVKDDGQGSYTASAAINGLRFSFTSGNISSGTIRIYGLAK